MEINNQKAKKLKKDFPIFKYHKKLVYLDNAAISAVSIFLILSNKA